MNMFDSLVSIKAFRENKAEVVVSKQRTVLAQAARQRDTAEKTLHDWRDYATEHERALYRALCQRVVRLREIEDVQLEVVSLREKEARHEQELRDAEADRKKQAEQLDADRVALREANRMKEKFVELARIHSADLQKEVERKEESELEEVAETRRPRGIDSQEDGA